jgi:hypothetical protein
MGEVMMATPAVSDGMLFIRTKDNLYAIGDAPAPSATKAKSGK